jgi:hypothetical protein
MRAKCPRRFPQDEKPLQPIPGESEKQQAEFQHRKTIPCHSPKLFVCPAASYVQFLMQMKWRLGNA